MSDLIAAHGRGEDFNRDLALLQLGKSLAEGEPWSGGSSGAFAYEILWRSGLPDMDHILDAGLEAYGPIFGPIDKPSDIPSLCDSLGRP
jgi:hypothetical protein